MSNYFLSFPSYFLQQDGLSRTSGETSSGSIFTYFILDLIVFYFNNPPNKPVAFSVRDESDEVELFVVDAELLFVL